MLPFLFSLSLNSQNLEFSKLTNELPKLQYKFVIIDEVLWTLKVGQDDNGIKLILEKLDIKTQNTKSIETYVNNKSRYRTQRNYALYDFKVKNDTIIVLDQFELNVYLLKDNLLNNLKTIELKNKFNDLYYSKDKTILLSAFSSNNREFLPTFYYKSINERLNDIHHLKDIDYPELLRFIPRKTFDIFQNKILISNILEYKFYIFDIENESYKYYNSSKIKDSIQLDKYENVGEIYESISNKNQIVQTNFLNDTLILVTQAINEMGDDKKYLKHDIVNINSNSLVKSFKDKSYYYGSNKEVLWGKRYQVSNAKVISYQPIPYIPDFNSPEYKLQDSTNSYYIDNDSIQYLIRIWDPLK